MSISSIHVSLSPEQRQKNKEAVLLLVQQADYGFDVYKRFLTPLIGSKPLKLGQSYLSPFRAEKHPSFNLFRSTQDRCVWWKDQAGEGGDALKFIMRLFNCDYRDAVRKLRAEVLGLPADPDRLELLTNYQLKSMPPPKPPAPEYPKLITPMVRKNDFYQGPWADCDEKYFPANIFGAEVLHRYHCLPLDGYRYQQYDDNPQQVKDFSVAADWYIRQGMYAYRWASGEVARHKIVRPYTPPNPKNGRPRKWLSNTKRELDVFGEHLLPAEGEPPCEVACLLAGNRDTMAFHRLTGVPCVAMTAEGHLPTDEQLASWFRRAERWYILYDHDKTGQYFQAVLSDDWESDHYKTWLDSHREQAGRRFGFQAGLNVMLTHYGANDVTQLLNEKVPPHLHQRLGTWFRQAMGLF